jgi:PKD repeat protein
MINTLNEDFRRQNADASQTRAAFLPDAADAEIEFCLAAKDPNGLATTGITRTVTTEVYYDNNTETDKMKQNSTGGEDAWDPFNYLNIWICNISNYQGFGVAGYAYLPTFGMHGSWRDGLVIDFDIGMGDRTPTHEIGHYLGLKHTWGNNPPSCSNDDGHADTPNAGSENYGCSFSTNTCGTPNGDQIENFMSYAWCQNMYSVDQAAYMNGILSGTRSSLLSSTGCDAVGPPTVDFSAAITTVTVGSSVQFTDLSTGIPDTWAWSFSGGTPTSSTTKNPVAQYNAIGTYDVSLTASNGFGSDAMTKTNYIDVVALPSCGIAGGIFCEDFEGVTAPALPVGWATATTGTDGGFYTGDAADANAGNFWPVGTHTQFAMTNDDVCNCIKTGDYLTLPTLDFTGLSSIRMQFEYVDDRTYGGNPATVELNINNGGWNVLQTLDQSPLDPWGFANFQLSGTDNQSNIQIRFHYDDGGQWATGLAVDDVLIYEPPAYDAVLTDVVSEYTQIPLKHTNPIVLEATVENQGKNTCTNAQMTVNVADLNLNPVFTGTSNSIVSLGVSANGTLTVAGGFTPQDTGWYRREYIVSILETDGNLSNDTMYSWVYVSDSVYSRDNGNVTGSLGISDTNFAILGQTFELQTADYLNYIMSFSYGQEVGDTTRLVVWSMGSPFPSAEVAATAEYIFTPADTPSAVLTLPLSGGPILLSAGTYFVGLEDYWATDNNGLATTDLIYTPGTTFGQINYGAWDSLENLGGFMVAFVLRPMFASCNLSLNMSSGDATCGSCDGTATVNVTGGIGPYTYTWNDPGSQNTATAAGLCAGSYNVLVDDANGCSRSSGITVTDAAAISISVAAVDESCGNGNGTATATPSGGTGPYIYAWDDPGTQTTQTAVGLSAGTYNVTITDASGCEVSTDLFSAAIISSTPLVSDATATATNITCNGAADGMAIANATTGITPYTYAWDDPGNQTTQTAIGLLIGTYTVTVTDAFGCFMIATTAAITEPSAIVLSTSSTDATCGNADGSATVSITSGGTPPFSYLWDDSGAQTTAIASNLLAGGYSVTVTDANGCTETATATVTDIGAPTANATGSSLICNGDSDGTATVTVTGGAPPYAYSWNSSPVQTDSTATGLTGGTYTATVTDAIGCIAAVNATVSEPAALSTTTSTTNSSCTTDDGSATVAVTGGTGAYTYLWDDAGAQTTAMANGLGVGTYIVVVTDNNGCSVNDSATVSNANPPSLTDTATNESCTGSANGSATVSASGGTVPYSYLWDDAGAQTTATANGLGAGTYNVVVTDAGGCTANGSSTVGSDGGPSVTTTSVDASCGSDGSATASPSGGSTPYTYLWDDPGAQTTATATGLASGTYNITVMDAVGCTEVTSVMVSGSTALMVVTSSTATTQGNCTGTATATLTGGTSPYTYLWDDPGAQSTPTATGLCAGDFTVVIVDSNGCSITETITVSNAIGMGEIENSLYYNIYPNPSSGDVFVELQLEYNADVEIRVFNTIGKLISLDKLIHISDQRHIINCSEYAGGIYYLHLRTEEELFVNKISILR